MTEYLKLSDAVSIHKVLIAKYGGSEGIRDIGALESALYRPQTGYYNNIIEEATALFESLTINHPFIDGNKRVAFAVTDVFLRINGYKISAKPDDIYNKFIEFFEEENFNFEYLEKFLRANTHKL